MDNCHLPFGVLFQPKGSFLGRWRTLIGSHAESDHIFRSSDIYVFFFFGASRAGSFLLKPRFVRAATLRILAETSDGANLYSIFPVHPTNAELIAFMNFSCLGFVQDPFNMEPASTACILDERVVQRPEKKVLPRRGPSRISLSSEPIIHFHRTQLFCDSKGRDLRET